MTLFNKKLYNCISKINLDCELRYNLFVLRTVGETFSQASGSRLWLPLKKAWLLGAVLGDLPAPAHDSLATAPSSKLQLANTCLKTSIEYFVNYLIIKFLGTSK